MKGVGRRVNGSGSEIGSSFKAARNLSRDDIQYCPRTTRVCEPQTSSAAATAFTAAATVAAAAAAAAARR